MGRSSFLNWLPTRIHVGVGERSSQRRWLPWRARRPRWPIRRTAPTGPVTPPTASRSRTVQGRGSSRARRACAASDVLVVLGGDRRLQRDLAGARADRHRGRLRNVRPRQLDRLVRVGAGPVDSGQPRRQAWGPDAGQRRDQRQRGDDDPHRRDQPPGLSQDGSHLDARSRAPRNGSSRRRRNASAPAAARRSRSRTSGRRRSAPRRRGRRPDAAGRSPVRRGRPRRSTCVPTAGGTSSTRAPGPRSESRRRAGC